MFEELKDYIASHTKEEIQEAPKSYSVATQVINDFRNNKYEIYKTEIINSDTTYYYRLKQKE